MLGLKRGTVALVPHQKEWSQSAKEVCKLLQTLLGETALDIQHIGSTAISSIHAKPIIDIAVGVHPLDDILPYIDLLNHHHFLWHRSPVAGEVFL